MCSIGGASLGCHISHRVSRGASVAHRFHGPAAAWLVPFSNADQCAVALHSGAQRRSPIMYAESLVEPLFESSGVRPLSVL
eukprot:SAG11_NODE_17771_length_509_cov_1.139024_1_plen_80_part_10